MLLLLPLLLSLLRLSQALSPIRRHLRFMPGPPPDIMLLARRIAGTCGLLYVQRATSYCYVMLLQFYLQYDVCTSGTNHQPLTPPMSASEANPGMIWCAHAGSCGKAVPVVITVTTPYVSTTRTTTTTTTQHHHHHHSPSPTFWRLPPHNNPHHRPSRHGTCHPQLDPHML